MRSRRPGISTSALALAGLLAALTLAPSHADARRIFVPKTQKTIQAAIDAAAPGDTLWISKGVYRGPFVLEKKLLLFGEAGPESTILDGGDSVRVLHVEGVNGGGLVGLGIRGGKAVAGGGIYCLHDTLFSIDYCTLSKNWESGIAFWQCSSMKVADCVFKENKGSALQMNQTTAFLLNSKFTGNRATGGAALYLLGSELLFPARNLLFEDNRADQTMGGAILADSSRITLANCTFRRNSSAVAGGAVAGVQRAFVAVSRCEMTENHAAQGGAIHSDGSQMLIGFSLFVRNTATAGGAAVGLLGRYDANVNPKLSNNTFYKNTTNGSGATIFAVKSSPEIRKNIFVVEGNDQFAVAGIESSPLYECNLIHDPTGAAIGSLPSRDSLVGDPLFCDPANGNFDVRDLSPAIRATCGPVGARPVGCKSFQVQPAR